MCGRSIRRLTPEQCDRQEELADDRYEALFDEVSAQMVAENELEGGDCDWSPPFAAVHAKVSVLMRE